jgi:hypothetical protein
MKRRPPSSPISYSWQMFGWLTLAAARASRQKRLRLVSSSPSDSIVLTATVRSSRSSRAA